MACGWKSSQAESWKYGRRPDRGRTALTTFRFESKTPWGGRFSTHPRLPQDPRFVPGLQHPRSHSPPHPEPRRAVDKAKAGWFASSTSCAELELPSFSPLVRRKPKGVDMNEYPRSVPRPTGYRTKWTT